MRAEASMLEIEGWKVETCSLALPLEVRIALVYGDSQLSE